ncbi:MAG TPA: hypothetical protein VGL09_03870 [Methylomirabilota bacterium]
MAPGNEREAPPDRSDAAIVDQLLRKLRGNARSPKPVLRSVTRTTTSDGKVPPRPIRRRVTPTPLGTWGRVGLAVVVGGSVTQWPYERACDWWLLLYLAVVVVTVVTAVWAAAAAWRARLALAHVVALGTILWGLALGAQEVLPRVGYAKHRAVWRCPPLAAPAPPSSAAPR